MEVSGTAISILAVSPKTLAAELLISALSVSKRYEVVSHATSMEEALRTVQTRRINIALIDSEWSEGDLGYLQLMRRIRDLHCGVQPIVLLHRRDPQEVVECFRSGARGIFAKSSTEFKLLCKCVECVNNGQIWISNEELGWLLLALELSRQQAASISVTDARGVNLLSKREEDVVRLLMEGLPNREIAAALKLSEHTIKNYLFRIFDKLGVSNRMELMLYAMRSLKPQESISPSHESAGSYGSSNGGRPPYASLTAAAPAR